MFGSECVRHGLFPNRIVENTKGNEEVCDGVERDVACIMVRACIRLVVHTYFSLDMSRKTYL
jgi:hypothetical protein